MEGTFGCGHPTYWQTNGHSDPAAARCVLRSYGSGGISCPGGKPKVRRVVPEETKSKGWCPRKPFRCVFWFSVVAFGHGRVRSCVAPRPKFCGVNFG